MIVKAFILVVSFTCGLGLKAQTFSPNNSREGQSVTKPKITLKESPIARRASFLPSENLQKFKINVKPTADTFYSVYIDEYQEGKCQQRNEVEDNLITHYLCKANKAFKAEIVSDTTKKEKLAISILVPELIQYAYKKKDEGKVYKTVAFRSVEDSKDTTSPFLFIYEDDLNATEEMRLKQSIKHDSLQVDFNPQKKPFTQIKRYMVLFISKETKSSKTQHAKTPETVNQ